MDVGVQVALVSGALTGTVPAVVAAWQATRASRRVGNGTAPATELLTDIISSQAQILAGQAGQDKRLARLENKVVNCEHELCSLHKRIDQVTES